MKTIASLLALLLMTGCAKQELAPPSRPRPKSGLSFETKAPDDTPERQSLLDLSRGASVVSRTGESMLQFSALQAIDGDPGSWWATPPRDLPQSMIIALPARCRIDAVGIRTVEGGRFTAGHVQFDVSLDGRKFTPLATIKSADSGDAQWFDVTPTEAKRIRVTLVDAYAPEQDVHLCSVLARGAELEDAQSGDISGCWSVNGRATRFTRYEGHVSGVMEMGGRPLFFDGGSDGRVYRLNWIRGNDFGLAAITVSPDAAAMSGMQWHEEAIPFFFADSWFGARGKCGSTADRDDTALRLLQRVGRLSLFGLRFRDDGSLDAAASAPTVQWLSHFLEHSGARIVAHEFRQPTPERNREFARRELDALRQQLASAGSRVEFVARGSDSPRQTPVTQTMRAIYSSVDLEIRR